jgi:uncharacterized protein (TIGR00369 family)
MGVEEARERFARMPFAQFLGVEIVEVSHERAVLRLPFREDNANVVGVLHGGASASLIHMAGTLAAWTGIDWQVEPVARTVDLAVQYLAAGLQEAMTAEAVVLRRGRDLFFLDITVRGGTQQLISKGLMIYRAPQYTAPLRQFTRTAPPAFVPPHTTPPVLQTSNQDFTHKLHIALASHSPGHVRLTMPAPPTYHDEHGHLHAGALAALFDTAGTHAAWSLAQRHGSRGATIGIQVSYPEVHAEPVVAEAHVERRTEELCFSHVQIRTGTTHVLVATGNVSYRLLESR